MFFEGGGGVPPFVCTWGRWFLDYAYSLPLFFFQWQLIVEEYSEIMRQPWPPQSKMVLKIPLPVYEPGRFPFFITKLSCARYDSINFAEKVIFPKFLAYHPLCEQILYESAAYEPQANTAR